MNTIQTKRLADIEQRLSEQVARLHPAEPMDPAIAAALIAYALAAAEAAPGRRAGPAAMARACAAIVRSGAQSVEATLRVIEAARACIEPVGA